MYVQTPTHKFEESNTARHEHAGMAEQSENVEYAGAAVASPLRPQPLIVRSPNFVLIVKRVPTS